MYFRVSERQIYVFKVDNLNTPLNTVGLDVSPAILMPYYDEDSSTLFLTGRVRDIFCNQAYLNHMTEACRNSLKYYFLG